MLQHLRIVLIYKIKWKENYLQLYTAVILVALTTLYQNRDLEDHKMSYTGLPVRIAILACPREYQVKTLNPLNRKKEF